VSRSKLSEITQAQVRQRSGHLCEFCHASEKWQYVKFTVDHTVPLSLGGSDGLENLALACFHCNRRKTNRLTAIDPQSGKDVPLFNPRQDNWPEHFIWSRDGRLIIGLTATGRATVATLALNRERVIAIRSADLEIGRHPPADDPIQG
jgi:HNH endonuclease